MLYWTISWSNTASQCLSHIIMHPQHSPYGHPIPLGSLYYQLGLLIFRFLLMKTMTDLHLSVFLILLHSALEISQIQLNYEVKTSKSGNHRNLRAENHLLTLPYGSDIALNIVNTWPTLDFVARFYA